MRVLVLGAGVVGVAAAWYLAADGHEVVVVDRASGPALETSFANGGQISASHAEPWANPEAPFKVLKWLGREDAPLLFRLRADPAQWRFGLQFLLECLPWRTRRNTVQCLNLALYSLTCLKALRADTGIEYDHLERGILQFYTDHKAFDRGVVTARSMRELGCDRDAENGRRVRGHRTCARAVPRPPRRRHLHRERRIRRRAALHVGARARARRRAASRSAGAPPSKTLAAEGERRPRRALRGGRWQRGSSRRRCLRRRARQLQPVAVAAARRAVPDLSGQRLFGDDRGRRPPRRADRLAHRSRVEDRADEARRPPARRRHGGAFRLWHGVEPRALRGARQAHVRALSRCGRARRAQHSGRDCGRRRRRTFR